MSHQLRKDKTCQNCSHFVEGRFCPMCGQENTETRQSFYHLFTHFAEDFVHYDSQFWKTIQYLLFSPAKLTREYLSGKRKGYMPPVQLYIFISFITFFVPAILPDFGEKEKEEHVKAETLDIKADLSENRKMDLFAHPGGFSWFGLKNVKSVNQLDSLQQNLPKEKQLSYLKYYAFKKVLQKTKDYSKIDEDIFKEKVAESFMHNLPKTLFVYMPFFAAFLWLFHSKKKWFYFDHGIFTLHFFSFMLLLILLVIVFYWSTNCLFEDNSFIELLQILLSIGCFFYSIFYFFRSHRRMYGERKFISRLKGTVLFTINTFFMLLILTVYSIYTLLSIH